MTIQQNPAPRFHTIKHVAKQLQVSAKSIRRWIDAGRLGSHRIGRQIRISAEDLERFLSTCQK
jgi:putative molybdopterin biosynthesis protein